MKITGSNESLNFYIDRSETAILRRAYKSRAANDDEPFYASFGDDDRSTALYQDEDHGTGGIANVPIGSNFIIPSLSAEHAVHVVADIVENLLVYKQHINKAEDEKRIDDFISLIAAKTAGRLAAGSTLDISHII